MYRVENIPKEDFERYQLRVRVNYVRKEYGGECTWIFDKDKGIFFARGRYMAMTNTTYTYFSTRFNGYIYRIELDRKKFIGSKDGFFGVEYSVVVISSCPDFLDPAKQLMNSIDPADVPELIDELKLALTAYGAGYLTDRPSIHPEYRDGYKVLFKF